MQHRPDPYKHLPLDERIRLAEQSVIDRDERLHRLTHALAGRWHDARMPGVAQGAGAGLLAGLGSWFVRRAFAARPAARRAGSTGRLDLVLQFLPLLLPVLPAKLQHWIRPSRLMLGLALAAPLWAAWQAKRDKAREEADERALIERVLAEQQRQHDALREQSPPQEREAADAGDPAARAEDRALHDIALHRAVAQQAQAQPPLQAGAAA